MKHWAVVTGGSQGIGAAISKKMRADGFNVAVMDIKKPAHQDFDTYLHCDLTDPRGSAAILGEFAELPSVTRLVHNAGICVPASLLQTTEEAVLKEMQVIVLSAISLSRTVVPHMKKAGIGRIVVLGSRSALGKIERTGYAAAKAALTGLVRTWALELGPYGITANCVSPGPTQTDLIMAANPTNGVFLSGLADRIPVGFISDPKDQAHAVSFFCSDEARFITGQVLNVCGGTSVNFLQVRPE